MGMLRTVVDEEYLPEFSTLVVCDKHLFGQFDGVPEALTSHAFGAQPGGTMAVAGAGWLKGAAEDDYQEVRLEAHDAEPPADTEDWLDVLETPYLSVNGSVGLSTVTGGDIEGEALLLGAPGQYRVRVSRRRHPDSGSTWRLQFWPVAEAGLPRWLARNRPAVQEPRDRWQSALGHGVYELVWVVNGAGAAAGATVAEIEAWCDAHSRPPGWLNQPLWADPPLAAPTGHADLDAQAGERRRIAIAHHDQQRATLADTARQLGVPTPTSRREVLSLLVAAGPLSYDESTARYRRVVQPPRVRDVLELSPEEVRRELSAERMDQYTCVTADLVAAVMWSPGHRLRISRAGLADLLLTTRDEVDAIVEYALEANALTGSRRPDDGFDLTLRARKQSAPAAPASSPPRPAPVLQPADRPAPAASSASSAPSRLRERLGEEFGNGGQPGEPPRAGIVTSGGGLVVWRDGLPVELARPWPRRPDQAIETAYGTALLSWGQAPVLVGRDGETSELGGPDVMPGASVSLDGRFLAMTERRYGRRPRFGVRLVDLADGGSQALPWDDSREVAAIGVHGGVVLLNGEVPGEPWPVGWRWAPGSDPERAGGLTWGFDPLTGAVLTQRDAGKVVVTADGVEHPVQVEGRLAPGGDRLFAFRNDPPGLTLFGLDSGADDPRMIWLPQGSRFDGAFPVAWEDQDHLLVSGRDSPGPRALGVRVDLRSGELEVLGGGDAGGYGPAFVEPWLGAPPGER